MKKFQLIALVALAAASVPGLSDDVPEGAAFDLDDKNVADDLVANGKAKLAEAEKAAAKEKAVAVRVLAACSHGKPDDVVELPQSVAKDAERDGQVDSNKDAVAYARTLPQNQPKKKA